MVGTGSNPEYIITEVWCKGQGMVIINVYNPCKRLELGEMMGIQGQDKQGNMVCGF